MVLVMVFVVPIMGKGGNTTYRIHGTGIFTYMNPIKIKHSWIGKYVIFPMDPSWGPKTKTTTKNTWQKVAWCLRDLEPSWKSHDCFSKVFFWIFPWLKTISSWPYMKFVHIRAPGPKSMKIGVFPQCQVITSTHSIFLDVACVASPLDGKTTPGTLGFWRRWVGRKKWHIHGGIWMDMSAWWVD